MVIKKKHFIFIGDQHIVRGEPNGSLEIRLKNTGLLWHDCIRTKEASICLCIILAVVLIVPSFSNPTLPFLVWLKSPEETPSCPEVKEKVNRRPQKSVGRPVDFT